MVNIIMLEEKYGQLCDTVYYVSALQFFGTRNNRPTL